MPANGALPYKIVDSGLEVAVRLTPKGGRDRLQGTTVDADGRVWLAARVSAPPEGGPVVWAEFANVPNNSGSRPAR